MNILSLRLPGRQPRGAACRAERRLPLALLCALTWALPAAAQVPPEAIARALALATEAASTQAPADARVVAQPGALDARLTLAPCGRVDAYLPSGVPAWGATRMGLRCTDGHAHWNVYLPVTVQVWAPAVVVMAALPAGARLTESQLGQAEIDWAASSSPAFSSPVELAGRTLVRPLASGQALRNADLQPRRWFSQGDTVRIVATGAGFSISAEGQAMSAGLDGQPARVRVESGRVLVGRPVSDRCIEVAL